MTHHQSREVLPLKPNPSRPCPDRLEREAVEVTTTRSKVVVVVIVVMVMVVGVASVTALSVQGGEEFEVELERGVPTRASNAELFDSTLPCVSS